MSVLFLFSLFIGINSGSRLLLASCDTVRCAACYECRGQGNCLRVNNCCASDLDCASNKLCNADTNRCEVCQVSSDPCVENYEPQCCDNGEFYSNTCYATSGCGRNCRSCQTCGGFAGTVCTNGAPCLDISNDSCNPTFGGADCLGYCPQVCDGKQGLQCDGGKTCVDIPDDGCDKAKGDADCLGYCQ
eukprot:11256_1